MRTFPTGAGTRSRTRDLLITSQLLYQLSYAGAGPTASQDAERKQGWRGWGTRIRTWECRYQKPVPYHLAIPQQLWWPERESNPRHGDFQSPALPTELSGRCQRCVLNPSRYFSSTLSYQNDGDIEHWPISFRWAAHSPRLDRSPDYRESAPFAPSDSCATRAPAC